MNITFENLPDKEVGYPRIHKLSDGKLYLSAQRTNLSGVLLFNSSDFGQTWENEELVATPESSQVIMNADFCEDRNHTIHYVYNVRPTGEWPDPKFYIYYKRKVGNTWGNQMSVYYTPGGYMDGDKNQYFQGCYEPSVIEIPKGIAIFFSTESGYQDTHDQTISARMLDLNGNFITNDIFVTTNIGGRDGMFVPKIYKNTLVGCVEGHIKKGYGTLNEFGTYIFKLDLNYPFSKPVSYNDSRRKAVIPSDGNPYFGAPYIAISELGETILIGHNGKDIHILASDNNCDGFYPIQSFSDVGNCPTVEFIDINHIIVGWQKADKTGSSFKIGTITR